MTRKREYMNLAMRQPLEWLEHCASNPGPYMRPIHVRMIRLAIRYKRTPD